MFGTYFYHQKIRKAVAIFGRLFNNLYVVRLDANGQVLTDDFSENNGSVGVTFSLTNTSNITTLNYVTTSTGSTASFKYSIRTLS